MNSPVFRVQYMVAINAALSVYVGVGFLNVLLGFVVMQDSSANVISIVLENESLHSSPKYSSFQYPTVSLKDNTDDMNVLL